MAGFHTIWARADERFQNQHRSESAVSATATPQGKPAALTAINVRL